MFQGVCTALITPFDGMNVDFYALEKFLDFQLENGIKSFCPCGTTGEIATLTDDEYLQILKIVAKKTDGKAFIIPGVGGNNTLKVIENCKKAEQIGVNAVLAVCPYYNKPTQDGLLKHFEIIAKSTILPVILYNVPGRTVTNISNESIAKLAKIPNIKGLKDATGDLERIATLRTELQKNSIPLEDFTIYSGDDILTLGFIAMGAKGVISVASNIMPKKCLQLCDFALSEDFKNALKLQDELADLFDKMFIETNPMPIKYAVSKLGFMKNELRLPLIPLSDDSKKIIDTLMQNLNI